MTSPLLAALRSGRVLLMDGAMGTELRRLGLRDGECGELWNITYPERVRAVHQEYVDAGADVILTNTFLANPGSLARHGLADRHLSDIWDAAPRLVGGPSFILGDIGPVLSADGAEVADLEWLPRPAVDGILLETWSSPEVLTAAAGRRGPVLVSPTYRRDPAGRLVTLSGHPPEWFAERAKKDGVMALGVNCGRDIAVADCAEIVRRYRAVTDVPLFARPNAGTPKKEGDRWVYPHTPVQMAAELPLLLEAGVSMVGGCCGTTPAHIAAFRDVIEKWT